MAGAGRVNRDNAQGIILGQGAPSVKINSLVASVIGDRVAPHGKAPHTSATILDGSETVFVEGKPLTVEGSQATCSHTVTPGSENVKAAPPGATSGNGRGTADALQIPPAQVGNVYDGVFVPPDPYSYDHARRVVTAAGNAAVADEEVESSFRANLDYPPENPPAANANASTDTTPPAPEPANVTPGCGDVVAPPVDYSYQLSANYQLRDVSTQAIFSHKIQAQNGLTEEDIICNLKAVAENILEPLRAQYPGFNINSGFRRTSGSSQHGKGEAVDIQWPGLSAAEYTERAEWVRDNLAYDQFIFEHGNSIWFHISHVRGGSQRRSILTYYPPGSPDYQAGITNYYA